MKRTVVTLTLITLLTSVVLLTLFGDNLRALFGQSASSLAGEATVTKRTTPGLERKGLKNFTEYTPDPEPTGNSHLALAPNRITDTSVDHLSTFAIDIDSASYTLARRTLNGGQLPTPAGVRVEEWVNAFSYDLPRPASEPFAVSVEGAPSPYQANRTLLKVALQGRVVADADRMPAHLVLLVDVSGSMNSEDRLPLAKEAMRVLVSKLGAQDTVAIVTYAGATAVVLEPTSGADTSRIVRAIDGLSTGGGTAMGSGMQLAYALALPQVSPRATTRVLVFTDGDANIGRTSPEEILAAVKGAVAEGVTLTTVGFGMGNYHDSTLERLADSGNGESVYVDSLKEAQKLFGTNLTSTLEHLAKDVKVQVDFDPEVVSHYRLLGYENRAVRDEDFRDDRVDGGELGAGHSVTALYELELTGAPGALGTVRVRGQHVNGRGPFEVAQRMERAVLASSLDAASTELRFATAVALAADSLRGNAGAADWSLSRIADLASEATCGRPEREEFVGLVRTAVRLRESGAPVAARSMHSAAGY